LFQFLLDITPGVQVHVGRAPMRRNGGVHQQADLQQASWQDGIAWRTRTLEWLLYVVARFFQNWHTEFQGIPSQDR